MRRLTLILFLFAFSFCCFAQTNTSKDSLQSNSAIIKVTLLGTGNPQPVMDRFGPSILVEAGSQTLLFDAGRGCLQRLRQLNLSYDQLDALFLTHLHSDHVVGLSDLWLTGWLVSTRSVPLSVYGPAGTNAMVDYLQKAFAFDIKIRVEDDKKIKEGSKLVSKEIRQGTVYEKNGVRVIAFTVDHHPDIPAFGYRVEYKGHSVVLSGDTRFSPNLISFAKGTDLLVHEVIIAPDTVLASHPKYAVFAHHTTAEQAAKVFTEVNPKLAVYSHITKPFGLNEPELLRRTKAAYLGPVLIGEDLMRFSIGDSVSVESWKNK